MSDFLTVKILCRWLKLKTSTAYSLCESNKIPYYRIGRLIRFKKSEIENWVKSLKTEPVSAEEEARRILGKFHKSVAQARNWAYNSRRETE
jgi:excisionase family DNA binding protein